MQSLSDVVERAMGSGQESHAEAQLLKPSADLAAYQLKIEMQREVEIEEDKKKREAAREREESLRLHVASRQVDVEEKKMERESDLQARRVALDERRFEVEMQKAKSESLLALLTHLPEAERAAFMVQHILPRM